MERRTRWLGWIAVPVLVLDAASKHLLRGWLDPGAVVPLVDGWISLAHRSNRGIAFSLLSGPAGAWRTVLLVALALVAVALLIAFIRGSTRPLDRLAGGLVLGGALGNLLDRLGDGAVTDFVAVRYFPYVFNVADAAITVGAALFLLGALSPARLREAADQPAEAPPPAGARPTSGRR